LQSAQLHHLVLQKWAQKRINYKSGDIRPARAGERMQTKAGGQTHKKSTPWMGGFFGTRVHKRHANTAEGSHKKQLADESALDARGAPDDIRGFVRYAFCSKCHT
jgi:hypothetical protein